MDVLIEAWASMRQITDYRLQMPHTEDMSHTDNILHTERTELTPSECLSFRCAQEITTTQHNQSKLCSASLNRNFPTDDTDCSDSNSSFSSIRSLTSSKIARRIDTDFDASHVNGQQSTVNGQLSIVGDGPERGRLERLVDELGVRDSVRFVGQVDMETYYSYIAQADVVVNPCFREGAVTVSFDSMAMGKPLICFDTGGYTHSFEHEYSRVIKGVTSREEAVERLAQAMAELADKELCAKMGAEAKRRSEELSWEKRGEVFSAIL